jgi:hypothetical protein
MRCTGNIACMGEKRNAHKDFVFNPAGRRSSEMGGQY